MDIPLNELGRKQADVVGETLRETPFDLAFSSPYSRAYDTASAVLKANVATGAGGGPKVEVEKREKLSERSFGEADGKPHQFYKEIAEKAGSRIWIHVPEGGESPQDVIARSKVWLEVFDNAVEFEGHKQIYACFRSSVRSCTRGGG